MQPYRSRCKHPMMTSSTRHKFALHCQTTPLASLSMYVALFCCSESHTDMKQIPDNMSFNDQLLFNITLLYPQTSTTAQVDSFATYLPFFTQTFGNFGGYVNFEKVYIEGPVSRIFVGVSGRVYTSFIYFSFALKFIEAREILVETSLEPIFGQFAASRSLTVSTIQAYVFSSSLNACG